MANGVTKFVVIGLVVMGCIAILGDVWLISVGLASSPGLVAVSTACAGGWQHYWVGRRGTIGLGTMRQGTIKTVKVCLGRELCCVRHYRRIQSQ